MLLKYMKQERKLHANFVLNSRSAAEIDELYERKIPAWRWEKTVTAAEEQMHVVVQVKGKVNDGQRHRVVESQA